MSKSPQLWGDYTVVQWCESRHMEEIYIKESAAMRWQLASRRRLLLIACQVLLKGLEKMVISGTHTSECSYDWLGRCDKEGMDHPPHSADFDSSDNNTCHFTYLPYIATAPCHRNETNWTLLSFFFSVTEEQNWKNFMLYSAHRSTYINWSMIRSFAVALCIFARYHVTSNMSVNNNVTDFLNWRNL